MAHHCMWFVTVIGYPAIGLLGIWAIRLNASDAWLPALGAVFIVAMTLLSLAVGRAMTDQRPLVGLFGIAGGLGNAGITMGAFLCYMFFGDGGLGRAQVYCLPWNLLLSLLIYPIARHYGQPVGQPVRLGRLMWQSLWDIRSAGLPASLAGLALSLAAVPRPAVLVASHLTDIITFVTVVLAFFGVGLQLRGSLVRRTLGLRAALAVVRFLVGPAIGLALAAMTAWTAWPLRGEARGVMLVESCIPTAITMVAIGNLFQLRPREASAVHRQHPGVSAAVRARAGVDLRLTPICLEGEGRACPAKPWRSRGEGVSDDRRGQAEGGRQAAPHRDRSVAVAPMAPYAG